MHVFWMINIGSHRELLFKAPCVYYSLTGCFPFAGWLLPVK